MWSKSKVIPHCTQSDIPSQLALVPESLQMFLSLVKTDDSHTRWGLPYNRFIVSGPSGWSTNYTSWGAQSRMQRHKITKSASSVTGNEWSWHLWCFWCSCYHSWNWWLDRWWGWGWCDSDIDDGGKVQGIDPIIAQKNSQGWWWDH